MKCIINCYYGNLVVHFPFPLPALETLANQRWADFEVPLRRSRGHSSKVHRNRILIHRYLLYTKSLSIALQFGSNQPK